MPPNLAASPRPTLGLMPLDDRPVSLSQPRFLADCAGYDLLVPPQASLGHRSRPGKCSALGRWLIRHAGDASGWVISMDMLAYGGLVASRAMEASLKECLARLGCLRQAGKRKPLAPRYGFQAIRRLASTIDTSQDLRAWRRTHASGGPAAHRMRNHRVNRWALSALKRGDLEWLSLLQEDASVVGPHIAEQKGLRLQIQEDGLSRRASITTGTDEASMLLIARQIIRARKRTPRVLLRFSSARGARRAALYEDRPIEETVRGQLAVIGAAAPRPQDATVELHVWCPDAEGVDLSMQAAPPDTPRRAAERARFVEGVRRSLSRGRKVAVADVAYANGADPDLCGQLSRTITLCALSGYAAWNTAANAVGCVLAQAALELRDDRFLMMRFVEDWGYQTVLRPRLRDWVAATLRADPWSLTPAQRRKAERWLKPRLAAWCRGTLAAHFPGGGITPRFRLPWSRLFEIETWHTF